MRFREQNGNVFAEVSKDEWKYVPPMMEQNGNIFEFDKNLGDYKFVSPVMKADPKNNDTRLEAFKTGVEKGMSLGTSPVVAGLGAGAGSFVGSLQTGSSLLDAIKAAGSGFSEGRDEYNVKAAQLQRDNPTLSAAGNLVGSIATTPFLPVKTMGQALKVGALTGAGESLGTAESVGEAAQNVAGGAVLGGVVKGGGDLIGKGISKVTDVGKALIPEKFMLKVAASTTGIPKKDIETYVKNVDDINALISANKGDVTVPVDEIKRQLNSKIQETKTRLGKGIEKTIKGFPNDKAFPTDDIIFALEQSKGKINEKLKPEVVQQIDDLIAKVNSVSDDSGNVNLKTLNEVKNFLMEESKGSYKRVGDIFAKSANETNRAAKDGYFAAKEIIDNVSPVIKEANNQLHQLHNLEAVMNKNLIGEGKPEGAFLQAVSGENVRNQNILKQLGSLTGYDPIATGEKVSAMRSFTNPGILPQGERTGFVLGRIGVGAGLGYGLAKLTDSNEAVGTAIGASITGPTALKAAINAGNISKKAIDTAIGKLSDPVIRSTIIQTFGKENINDDKLDAMKRRLMLSR